MLRHAPRRTTPAQALVPVHQTMVHLCFHSACQTSAPLPLAPWPALAVPLWLALRPAYCPSCHQSAQLVPAVPAASRLLAAAAPPLALPPVSSPAAAPAAPAPAAQLFWRPFAFVSSPSPSSPTALRPQFPLALGFPRLSFHFTATFLSYFRMPASQLSQNFRAKALSKVVCVLGKSVHFVRD